MCCHKMSQAQQPKWCYIVPTNIAKIAASANDQAQVQTPP